MFIAQSSSGKKIRNEKQTGLIRTTDHIRDYVVWGDPLYTEYEADLMERYVRLDNWNDHSAYKDRDGHIIPEYLYMMFAIKGYFSIRESDAIKSGGQGKGHPGDF